MLNSCTNASTIGKQKAISVQELLGYFIVELILIQNKYCLTVSKKEVKKMQIYSSI
jgi:hypothetical protein